jgi:hypothetical protein
LVVVHQEGSDSVWVWMRIIKDNKKYFDSI